MTKLISKKEIIFDAKRQLLGKVVFEIEINVNSNTVTVDEFAEFTIKEQITLKRVEPQYTVQLTDEQVNALYVGEDNNGKNEKEKRLNADNKASLIFWENYMLTPSGVNYYGLKKNEVELLS